MKTQVKMLKVKIKSLAAEAKIIRLEERRAGKDEVLRASLRTHRIRDVRREQRASLLAYGFLRGRSLASIERNPKVMHSWSRVSQLVRKFGTVSPVTADLDAQNVKLNEWIGSTAVAK